MNLMHDHEVDLNLLFSLTTRPPLYMRSGNYIWTDDHVGRQMLKLHLDPNIDSASLKHSTIDHQVDWITNLVGNPNGKRLLDIGCGPGLFCERFHSAGFSVRGMDFNTHSIAYARKSAETGELSIEYVYGDYVHMQAKNEFDVITLINRDFSALTVSERDLLLRAVNDGLRPGGLFVFDVMSSDYFPHLTETNLFQVSQGDGFWASGPHLVLEQQCLFSQERVQLEKYTVVETDGTVRDFNNWLTYYTESEIDQILHTAGFEIVVSNPFLSDEQHGDPDMNRGFVAVKR